MNANTGVYIVTTCAVLFIVIDGLLCWRYMRRISTERLLEIARASYDSGRDDGEKIGVQRGYRLAMKHCALAAAGKPIKKTDIPWTQDEE